MGYPRKPRKIQLHHSLGPEVRGHSILSHLPEGPTNWVLGPEIGNQKSEIQRTRSRSAFCAALFFSILQLGCPNCNSFALFLFLLLLPLLLLLFILWPNLPAECHSKWYFPLSDPLWAHLVTLSALAPFIGHFPGALTHSHLLKLVQSQRIVKHNYLLFSSTPPGS